jgi:hypothetical protein
MLMQPAFALLLSCLPFQHAPGVDLTPSPSPIAGDQVNLGPTISIDTAELNIPFTLDLLRNRAAPTSIPRLGETPFGTLQVKGNVVSFKQGEQVSILSNPCPAGSAPVLRDDNQTTPAKRAMTSTIDPKAKRP